jgi:hypothetical protein
VVVEEEVVVEEVVVVELEKLEVHVPEGLDSRPKGPQ